MEVESNFLSLQDESETEKKRLCSMLTQVLLDLNRQKMCTLSGKFRNLTVFGLLALVDEQI